MVRAMRKVTFCAFALLVAASPFLACSGKKPPPPVTPTPVAVADADVEAGEGGVALGTAPDASAPVAVADAGAPVAVVDAGGLRPPNLAEALDSAIDLAIKAAAATGAPNMAAEGQPGRATLSENEHFNMIVTLQPNRCYTIIAFSPLGQVQQLDVKLMAPPFFNIPAGSSAATDKNTAFVGKGKGALCPILPVPIAYKIDVGSKKGAGRMGVQLFSRNK
jgi:hypothetical protein